MFSFVVINLFLVNDTQTLSLVQSVGSRKSWKWNCSIATNSGMDSTNRYCYLDKSFLAFSAMFYYIINLYSFTLLYLMIFFISLQDIKGEVNLGSTQRSMPMDPSSIYGQGIMQSKPGIGNTGNYD